MTSTLRRAGLLLIISILLAAFLADVALAARFDLGPVREQTIQWLMKDKKLSRGSAEQMMRKYARQNRSEILDSVEFPDYAVADFVEVDASGPGPVRHPPP